MRVTKRMLLIPLFSVSTSQIEGISEENSDRKYYFLSLGLATHSCMFKSV